MSDSSDKSDKSSSPIRNLRGTVSRTSGMEILGTLKLANVLHQSLQSIAYVLGALTAGGGTIGFVKTGSIPSIAAGLTVGLLYSLGGYRIQGRQPWGVELALLASVVLGGSSIPRAIRLGKPVPTLLSVLSVFGLVTFGNEFRKTL
ncbi:hypothetical protein SLS62_009990 [Diatrype stigma]|uniref:Transmembrane protein 14C n=1 Tax=Diatrype stigma TaxID=117547 RepID=A0AAN9YHA7_9PEZI